jgi:hypothetical protein
MCIFVWVGVVLGASLGLLLWNACDNPASLLCWPRQLPSLGAFWLPHGRIGGIGGANMAVSVKDLLWPLALTLIGNATLIVSAYIYVPPSECVHCFTCSCWAWPAVAVSVYCCCGQPWTSCAREAPALPQLRQAAE